MLHRSCCVTLSCVLAIAGCRNKPADPAGDPSPATPTAHAGALARDASAEAERDTEVAFILRFSTETSQPAFATQIAAVHAEAARLGFEPPIIVTIADPKPVKAFDGEKTELIPGDSRHEIHVTRRAGSIEALMASRALADGLFEKTSVGDYELVRRSPTRPTTGPVVSVGIETDRAALANALDKIGTQTGAAFLVTSLAGGNPLEQHVWFFGPAARRAAEALVADPSLTHPDGAPYIEVDGSLAAR